MDLTPVSHLALESTPSYILPKENDLNQQVDEKLCCMIQSIVNSALKFIGDVFAALHTILSEIIFTPINLFTHFLEPNPPAPDLNNNSQLPIVFVHGYKDNPTFSIPLRCYLRNNGYKGAFYHFSYDVLTDESIPTYSQRLAQLITQTKQETGYDKVLILGHSLGGTIGAYAKEKFAQEDVQGIVTAASPILGTKTAFYGSDTAAHSLWPGSNFLDELNDLIINSNKQTYCQVKANIDCIVIPSSNAFHPAIPEEQKLKLTYYGHGSLMISKRFQSKVLDFFNKKNLEYANAQ